MATTPDEEARVDAELREVEGSIAELQKRRAELLRAKGAMRWAKTKASVSGSVAPPPAATAQAAAAPSPESLKALERVLNSLEWSSFKKKEGEWTFLRNRDGSLVDALSSETEFVSQLKRGREMVVGRYRYVLSEDKFLNRYFNA
ncbi:MAG: hypothetical protein JRN23_01090 [Nitrososphaerota archaeon]|jgi:hypothetical protein|nr:hypothetical protein [Nitrososphaerota archaeon]MDG6978210.1 hypothetical protein [Nitrososphaerota archaeon]MDG7020507.1 hypothetical protein [Nitrososphaerota archaeon]MDG7021958.1 hypothetical protein [Nitrososphaerota archaeon]